MARTTGRPLLIDVLSTIANTNCVVTMTTGSIENGTVIHDVLVINEAPPRVLQVLVEQYELISIRRDGVHVPIINS